MGAMLLESIFNFCYTWQRGPGTLMAPDVIVVFKLKRQLHLVCPRSRDLIEHSLSLSLSDTQQGPTRQVHMYVSCPSWARELA